MKTEIKQGSTTLILDSKEASWLLGLVQNYLGEGEESAESKEMRYKFWNSLPSFEEMP